MVAAPVLRAEHRRLPDYATASFPPVRPIFVPFEPADVRFIDLDRTGERQGNTRECLSDPVQTEPRHGL